MKKWFIFLFLIFLIACRETTESDTDYKTDDMVPFLDEDGYKTIPVDDAVNVIAALAKAAGTAIPEPTVKAMSGVITFLSCMEDRGAWSSAAYYHRPEFAFGLAASASKAESTDAVNLGYCIASTTPFCVTFINSDFI